MSIPKVSTEQVKAARALLRWSQNELARASGVSVPTIKRLEAQIGLIGGRTETSVAICSALEAAGIQFFNENEDAAGVSLRKVKNEESSK
ncbi:helix-turn-helix transcriptional regulator [Roseovarius sp.]|uniref:helix-turn-helix transcriptional regulator n=1 Tax=Roseovarius sp. TaxID=1486281 RepID=UPI003BACA5BF